MGFDYSDADITPGRLLPVVMDMLPRDRVRQDDGTFAVGEYPVAWCEMLGDDNKTLMAESVRNADPKKAPAPASKKKKPATEADRLAELEQWLIDRKTTKRADIRHSVRRIDCYHKDGVTKATEQDIPDWIASLPDLAVERIWAKANNQLNYQNGNFADPKDIAEK
jgi:hypothetical protein